MKTSKTLVKPIVMRTDALCETCDTPMSHTPEAQEALHPHTCPKCATTVILPACYPQYETTYEDET